MCDWNEEEYSEYLLWAEAATARARVPERKIRIRATEPPAGLPELLPQAVEA